MTNRQSEAEHVTNSQACTGVARSTLSKQASISGVGLFTAMPAQISIEPSAPGTGLVFVRADLDGSQPVPADVANVRPSPRRTTLGVGDASIQTVEHLLAACVGLGVTDAVISVDGPEVPIMDGSALPFAEAMLDAGITEHGVPVQPVRCADPITAAASDAVITAVPSDDEIGQHSNEYSVRYTLDYDNNVHVIPATVGFRIDPETFLREIAPARTFSTRPEAEAARAHGLFTHVEPKDMLVLEHGVPIDNTLRFDDEPARHKVLDVLGDLALIGSSLSARIVASRSGHALHHDLAQRIVQAQASKAFQSSLEAPELDIDKVLSILPHRFPFVLVDRVLEIADGHSATGIKNVTINEPFFQGHYPHSPIMPGVLIVEAMCQLAGLMLHETLDHEGKVALLLSMDGIRLRRAVRPGDQLILRSTQIKGSARAAEVSCTAHVHDELVAEVHAKFLLTTPPTA